MELQEVEVFIEKDGSVRVEVRGVKGMSCLDVAPTCNRPLMFSHARQGGRG